MRLRLLALALLPLAAQAAPQKVLFTTFDPFGGSSANNTQAIGAQLKAHPEWIGADAVVAICNLPVVYGEAPKQALACIASEKPDLVISLGEADCSLQVESAANNSDDTPGFPDNAGVIRDGQPIIVGAPDRLGLAFPVEAMMCAIDPNGDAGVIASITPGNFVCNNVAYSLAYALPTQQLPFAFIHVPNSQCAAAQVDPEKNAKLIAKAAAAAEAALESPWPTGPIWRPAAQDSRMPSDVIQLGLVLSDLASGKGQSCELTYAQRLNAQYQSPDPQ